MEILRKNIDVDSDMLDRSRIS